MPSAIYHARGEPMPLYAVTFEDKAGTTVPVRIRAATAEQAIAQAHEPARYVTA